MQQQHPPTYKHVTHVTQYKFNQGLSLTLQLERDSPNTGYLSALAKATEVGSGTKCTVRKRQHNVPQCMRLCLLAQTFALYTSLYTHNTLNSVLCLHYILCMATPLAGQIIKDTRRCVHDIMYGSHRPFLHGTQSGFNPDYRGCSRLSLCL